MGSILVADNSPRDAQNFRALIEAAGLSAEVCVSGKEAAGRLEEEGHDWRALFILWEIPGPPFGLELLTRSRRLLPGVPVVVISSALDASLATRAYTLGAKDFLEKPLDLKRVKSCLTSLLDEHDPYAQTVEELKKTIRGESPALLATLRHVAKVIGHKGSRVLLIGDSGTGKELIARAIHDLGPAAKGPFVAVNVAAIPKHLIESALFGHEKGAFTGATGMHRGYMEEAGDGTLFLDEIGELKPSLQVKLLRAIQEKKFRRLKGTREIDFRAGLVCATNVDLARAVKQGNFRQDLFHRIAEVTVHLPALRERTGDVDLLLEHFQKVYGEGSKAQFARETLTILHSYHFPGNIRELENIVKTALMNCDGDLILPKHLPLSTMGTFLAQEGGAKQNEAEPSADLKDVTHITEAAGAGALAGRAKEAADAHEELFRELARTLPDNWRDLPYKKVMEMYTQALDRIYFPRLVERHLHNMTRATKAAGVDKKTFAQHLKDAGPPPRAAEGESHD